MDFSSNYINQFPKMDQNNIQNFNFRYFPKESNNKFLLNNLYPKTEISKSEENDYINKITDLQLNSLKLYKFYPNIKKDENEGKYEEENYDQSSFIPIKELIKIDFEKISKSENLNSLKQYLPQLTFQKYKNKDLPVKENSHTKLILSKYQQILKYLSNLEKRMDKFNILMEQNTKNLINVELTNFGKEKAMDKQIEENGEKINILLQKINQYKNIIISANKNSKRSLASFVFIINDENNNFYCDLCPNEIFPSYKDVQIHSLYIHEHILKLRKKNYEINNNIYSHNNSFERNYIDSQMNLFKNELNSFIEKLNSNTENKIVLNNNSIEKEENFETNKDDKIIDDKSLILIEKKINILEENQRKNQELLLDNLNEFKKEIIGHLINLKNNQSLINPKKENNIIKKENDINSNNQKIENNDAYLNNNNFQKNNLNEKNAEETINTFQLGEVYQDNTLVDSYNYNLKKEENNSKNLTKNKNNVDQNLTSEKPQILNEGENINKIEEMNYNKNNKKDKIQLGEVKKPNFEIKQGVKLEPKINNFAKKFYEREKNILFTSKIKQGDITENYNILENTENINSDNEDVLIQKLSEKYNLNKKDLSKSGYNNIINEIIEKNENIENENYKAYFKNIISFLEINKDLNSSIIK